MSKIFTVIVLSYNNSQFIEGCLDSIFRQTYSDIEIIIADDCSTEFEINKYKSYCEQNNRGNIKNILVLKNAKNLGTVKNINNAIQHANGSFFKLIGADDELADHDTLNNAAKFLIDSPFGIITSDVIKCDPKMKEISLYPNRLQAHLNDMSSKECFKRLCIHNDIIAGGVFFSKHFFEIYGYFDERYRLLEDWPMWLRVTAVGGRIVYCPFNAIKYRSDVGLGTSMNPFYMQDKKEVFNHEIKTRRKYMGILNYYKAIVSFYLINSMFVRKIYGLIKRRGNIDG